MRPASLVFFLTLACVARAPRLEPAPRKTVAPLPAVSGDASGRSPSPSTIHAATKATGTDVATQPAVKGLQERCPPEMALIERPQGSFCIDRWEASLERVTPTGAREPWPSNLPVDGGERDMIAVSRAGVKPQGYISGAQASVACENGGKRLCSIDEWLRSCRGPSGATYPYGNERRAGACNDRTLSPPAHPVVRLFEQFAPKDMERSEMWHLEWMNDPRLHELSDTVAPTGSHAECRNEYGVYDLVGNLHEWIADPEGTFVGGFFMDTLRNGEGCNYRTSAHNVNYHDYSTGFRCCADAPPG